jgi:cell division septation protein DedD
MPTADDGVREIQLNGKQLVFLFMAVTVVSVVIFLCGVLVGRGVQVRTPLVDAPALAAEADAADDLPVADAPSPSDGPTTQPPLKFPSMLTAEKAPNEKLAPASAPPSAPPKAVAPSATQAEAATAERPASAAATSTPAPGGTTPAAARVPTQPRGAGFAIQVAALRGREEAEAIVTRLASKGYAAYLMTPLACQPSMFRVRVGKFRDRSEAEVVATRLEREEQFKPWITR